jgi:hypothetical protein
MLNIDIPENKKGYIIDKANKKIIIKNTINSELHKRIYDIDIEKYKEKKEKIHEDNREKIMKLRKEYHMNLKETAQKYNQISPKNEITHQNNEYMPSFSKNYIETHPNPFNKFIKNYNTSKKFKEELIKIKKYYYIEYDKIINAVSKENKIINEEEKEFKEIISLSLPLPHHQSPRPSPHP